MSLKGLIGIAMVCIAAIVIAMIQTGPRAQYWRSLLGTHYSDPPTRIEQRGPNGERWVFERRPSSGNVQQRKTLPVHWIDTAVGRASGVIEFDQPTLFLSLEGRGPTTSASMSEISLKRRRLEAEIAKAGFDNVGYAELDVHTGKQGRGGTRSRVKLEVTFDQAVDVLALFSRPQFAGLGNIIEIRYLHSDINTALLPLKQAALERARSHAAASFDGLEWHVDRVSYEFDRTRLQRKSKYRQTHVSMAAVLVVRGTGTRVTER